MKRLRNMRFFLILFTVLLALCVLFSALATRTDTVVGRGLQRVFSPLTRLFDQAGEQVQRIGAFFSNQEKMQAQIDALQKELDLKNQQLTELQEKSESNDFLSAMLQLKQAHTDYEFVHAHVQQTQTQNAVETLILDRGADWGITTDMPVLTEMGLLGVVSAVGSEECTVTLLTDQTTQIGVYVEPGGGIGILQGDLSAWKQGCALLEGLPFDAQAHVGDTVRTSGSGGIYPRGLAVGTVEEITNDPGNGNLVLRVRPFTNGEDVGEVMVLTDFSTKIVDASPTESNS